MHTRHRKILEMLQTDRLYIGPAARELGVSEMTLRRDLHELEEQKLVMAVRGGAIMHPARYEPEQSAMRLTPEKFVLAEALYDEIMPCERLFIGSGFTTLAFAKLLAMRRGARITVVTNSLSAAAALFRTSHRVILLGGELRNNSMDLIGPIAERNLTGFNIEWQVAGCDFASPTAGFGTADADLARFQQQLTAAAAHTAIVTESVKFSSRPTNCFAAPYQVDLLVTDTALSGTKAAMLRNSGMKVMMRNITHAGL